MSLSARCSAVRSGIADSGTMLKMPARPREGGLGRVEGVVRVQQLHERVEAHHDGTTRLSKMRV